MILKETDLKNMIAESFREYLKEEMLKAKITNLIQEELSNFGHYTQFEEEEYDVDNKEDERLSDMNTETDKESETRASIESFFKQPGVNNAPYAYALYNVDAKEGQDTNDMKNARKKFSDCVNHEKNENGYPYSFSSDELTRLKNMISGNNLD